MATKEARQKHATREWTFLESIASSPSPLDFRVISSRGRSMFYKCKYIFQLFGKVQLGRFLVRKSNLTLFSSPPLTFPLFLWLFVPCCNEKEADCEKILPSIFDTPYFLIGGPSFCCRIEYMRKNANSDRAEIMGLFVIIDWFYKRSAE